MTEALRNQFIDFRASKKAVCNLAKENYRKLRSSPIDEEFHFVASSTSTTSSLRPSEPVDLDQAQHGNSELGFKDEWLKNAWQENTLPATVMDALNSIREAFSIFQLRKLLTPGTKLKILKGTRKGQISLRVNDQYRICFSWISGQGAFDIELLDYHKK